MTSVADRKYLDRQPWPILEFWEVEIDGGDNLFAVDFYDRSSDDVPPEGIVEFDGNDYIPVAMQRGDIQSSTGGDSVTFQVTFADPTGVIAAIFRENGWLSGARVTMRVIPYDQLGVPSSAASQVFTIRTVSLKSGPDAISVTIGDAADLFDHLTPSRLFSFHRCLNAWHKRHSAFDWVETDQWRFVHSSNWCWYPSDPFTMQQRLYWRHGATDAERLHLNGWRIINSTKADACEIAHTITSPALKAICQIEGSQSAMQWKLTTRTGPFMYKLVTLGDFELEVPMQAFSASHDRSDYHFGILAQDSTDEDSWLFFGKYSDGVNTGLRVRAVQDGVSSSEQVVSTSHDFLKLERTGTTWKCYSKPSEFSSADWTLRFTVSSFTLGEPTRIGLAIGSDDATTDTVSAAFHFFRFASGGPTQCNRTLDQCEAYENVHQYNAFDQMPVNA